MHYTTHQSNVVTLARDAIKSNEEKGGDAYKKKWNLHKITKHFLQLQALQAFFALSKQIIDNCHVLLLFVD